MSKIILLTGGSGGLGRSAAKQLLSEGHTVVITGRSQEKLKQAIKWINPSNPERLHTITLDLESLVSIQDAVESFKSLGFSTLDVLINNAGCTTVDLEYVKDTKRVEKTVFTNAIGPWYLTVLLRSLITPGGRVLFITSGLHDPKSDSVFKAIGNSAVNDPNLLDLLDGKSNYDGLGYYKISKLAVVWITYMMAKQFPEISINTSDPGYVPITDLNRERPWIFRAIMKISRHFLREAVSEEQCISEYVYYTTSKELDGVTSKYFTYGKETKSSERSYNVEEAIEFWNLTCEICNIPKLALKD
ncbi:hypothetical protein INT45_006401 [Circinella minor]|uniref:Uncharacterized protein n=1 Tax=Circinella minor TaxID=1195481 RepID=A0A8H7SB13_9FUNG|nr:hypothetical protein INT45_006401 [Circinella minor]